MKALLRLSILLCLVGVLWLGSFLAAGLPSADPWQAADLRALNPTPNASLMALLARQRGPGCEIRLDFLDLPANYQVRLRAGDQAYTLSPQTAAALRLQADLNLDTLTFSLPLCPPDLPLTAQVNGEAPLQTALNAPPAAAPLSFSLAFYNVFDPAFTPAQALRRWDGAHTGPHGERHGLKGLLQAAESSHTALILLDLKTPFALSALDALGGLPQIGRMEAAGLLHLPAVMYAPQDITSLVFSRSAAQAFGLRPSLEYFIVSPPNLTRPFSPQADLTRDGLALETRLQFYQALRSGVSPLLGGDLAKSTWGSGEAAAPALAWLAARPYFRSSAEILLVPQVSDPASASSFCSPDPNQIAFWPIGASYPALEIQASWLARRAPSVDPALAAVYGDNQAWAMEMVWAQHPAPQQGCKQRFCWLASSHFFAFFDLQGGKLTHLWHDQEQWLAPTSQFFVGFSDASDWNLQAGLAADPGQRTGSFAEEEQPFRPYRAASLKPGRLSLQAPGQARTFTLTDAGLTMTTETPLQTELLLAITPARRFSPGWAACWRLEQTPQQLRLGWQCGPIASIQAPAGSILAVDSPLAAPGLLASPEDPNVELPAGFFLPFPLTRLRLQLQAGQSVIIAP